MSANVHRQRMPHIKGRDWLCSKLASGGLGGRVCPLWFTSWKLVVHFYSLVSNSSRHGEPST